MDQNNENDNYDSENSEIIQSGPNEDQKIFLPKKHNMIRRMIGATFLNAILLHPKKFRFCSGE